MKNLPYEASVYIQEHFEEGFLSNVKPEKNQLGHDIFKVTVSAGDTIHHLEFNAQGKLVIHESEPAFDEDYFEDTNRTR